MTKRRRTHKNNPKKRKYKQTTMMLRSKKPRTQGGSLFNAAAEGVGGAAGRALYNATPSAQAAAGTSLENMIQMQAVEDIALAEDIDMFAVGLEATEAAVTAGSMFTGVGEAAAIAAAAGLVINTVGNMFTQQKETITALMSAGYGGNVGKLTKKSLTKMRDKYQAKGAVVITETWGNVQDSDCVIVGHNTFAINSVCTAIAYALLRKLFYKVGAIVETTSQEVTFIGTDTSGPTSFNLKWAKSDTDGTTSVSTGYQIPNDATLESIASISGLRSDIYDMITDENPNKIEKIVLEQMNGGASFQSYAQIIMKQEILEISLNVHTIVQNRTRAASGTVGTGSTDINQIDAQPVKGPVFEFDGIPKTKQANNVLMSTDFIQGIWLVGVNKLVGSDYQAWREPPTKKAFSNCVRNGYTRLNPGVMKDFSCTDRYRGYFQNILCGKWRVVTENNKVAFAPGKSQAVFLEEELNSGSANKISIQYETQHTIGAQFITAKAPNMQPYYTAEEINNI